MNRSNIDALIRPKTISQLFMGDTENTISKIVNSGFINHSFLLAGHTGGGKTTTARAIASYLFTKSTEAEYDLNDSNCYIEVNAGKYTGIDNMRELLDSISDPPLIEDKIVLVIDEAHLLTKAAQSALQKPIEEPPEYLYVMLCTNEKDKLKLEIINRCQLIAFRKPDTPTLIRFAREFAINHILDVLDSPTCTKCQSNIQALTNETLTKIVANTDMSYRAMIIKTYEYILTGETTAYIDTSVESISNIFYKIMKPKKDKWRQNIQQVAANITSYEDTRAALCNYVNAVYTRSLTKMSLNDTMLFMQVIDILRDPLSYTCQKADFIQRLSVITLLSAGIIKGNISQQEQKEYGNRR